MEVLILTVSCHLACVAYDLREKDEHISGFKMVIGDGWRDLAGALSWLVCPDLFGSEMREGV
jgi:hypothetical protein